MACMDLVSPFRPVFWLPSRVSPSEGSLIDSLRLTTVVLPELDPIDVAAAFRAAWKPTPRWPINFDYAEGSLTQVLAKAAKDQANTTPYYLHGHRGAETARSGRRSPRQRARPDLPGSRARARA